MLFVLKLEETVWQNENGKRVDRIIYECVQNAPIYLRCVSSDMHKTCFFTFWYLCYTWNFIHSHTDYGNVYYELTFTLWTQTISFCSTTNEFFTRVHRHSQEHKRTEITSPYGNLLLDKALLFCRKSVSYLIDISFTHWEYTPKYLRRNFIAQEILNQPKVNTIFIAFFLLYFSNAPSFFFTAIFFSIFPFFSFERQCILCIQRMEIGKYSKFLWMFESQKIKR